MNDSLLTIRRNRSLLLIVTWVLLYSPSLVARSADRLRTGTVRCEKNTSNPGVNIIVKSSAPTGRQRGTPTDVNGRYSLSVPEGAINQLSYIGYVSQEVCVGSQSTLDVQLKEDAQSLSEVVGYGAQKKSDLTGAVSTVSAKEISRSPVVGIDQALQGKAPGVRATQNSGAPGEAVAVRIRDAGTINDVVLSGTQVRSIYNAEKSL